MCTAVMIYEMFSLECSQRSKYTQNSELGFDSIPLTFSKAKNVLEHN